MHKLQVCAAVLTLCFQLGKPRDFFGVQGDYEFGNDFSPFSPLNAATDDGGIACSGCQRPTDISPIGGIGTNKPSPFGTKKTCPPSRPCKKRSNPLVCCSVTRGRCNRYDCY